MLSLECVCYTHSISSGVRYVSQDPVPSKVCQSLYQNGHEHIPSCLFLLLQVNVPLEGRSRNGGSMLGHTKTKSKYNITLRPVKNNKKGRRLGLYTADYRQHVENNVIKELHVDLGDNTLLNISALKTYVNYGSVTHPCVNQWLWNQGWVTPDEQLLFTLEVNSVKQIHALRFVKHV